MLGSVVVVHGLSHPVACGILPDQGSNLCLAPAEDSLPLSHQRCPELSFHHDLYLPATPSSLPATISLLPSSEFRRFTKKLLQWVHAFSSMWLPPLKKKKNWLCFLEKFYSHSKIGQKVGRFPMYPLPLTSDGLLHHRHPPEEWDIGYNWLTCIDTSFLPKVDSLP